jgi:DNA repair protein RadC
MIIDSSRKSFELFKKQFNNTQEEVWLLTLNSNLSAIDLEMIFRGTATHCIFHPRDLIRTICSRNASAFIIGHNHPSEITIPSRADKKVTSQIYEISKLIEIKFQDHLIFGKNEYFSFADYGLLT